MKTIKRVCSFVICFVFALSLILNAAKINANAELENIKVMCFGDSITEGYNVVGGYRYTLGNLLEENGYSSYVDFVGPNWGGNQYDCQHAGYSGYTIENTPSRSGLADFTQWLLGEYPADVIMLQIGTNDILDHYELETIGDRLENLVDMILELMPEDGMLFLATITTMDATNNLYIDENYFTVESMDAIVDSYNDDIRNIVAAKQSEGENIALCDWDGIITKSDLYDGVHPSADGYAIMGEHWYNILVNYMENGTTTPVTPSVVYGDVNSDGSINATDATLVARCAVGIITLDTNALAAADVNGDSKVNATDATLIARFSVGLLQVFPIEA